MWYLGVSVIQQGERDGAMVARRQMWVNYQHFGVSGSVTWRLALLALGATSAAPVRYFLTDFVCITFLVRAVTPAEGIQLLNRTAFWRGILENPKLNWKQLLWRNETILTFNLGYAFQGRTLKVHLFNANEKLHI